MQLASNWFFKFRSIIDYGVSHDVKEVILNVQLVMLLKCSSVFSIYKCYYSIDDNKVILHFQNDLDDPERGMILVCSATHKTKSMFFFLVQTEQGDVFKVTLETNEEFVTEIRLKYFDTVPVASAMCVLKTGFLFVASEFGNQ